MSMVLLAVALAVLPPDAPRGPGRALYTQYCASCHGADLRGGPNAPTLLGVGAAGADFWVTTGRMPAAVPWIQVGHRGIQPYLTPDEQNLIVGYVASAAPGPAIPQVVTAGVAEHGRTLFEENCMHCHGVEARGASIGRVAWAPTLERATVIHVAEAIRIGPGEMPQFSTAQLDSGDVNDIVTYLSTQRGSGEFAGLPVRAGGAVPEGLYGWLAAGALALFAYGFWLSDRGKRRDDT